MSYFGDTNLAEHILQEVKFRTDDDTDKMVIITALAKVIQYYSDEEC